MKLSILAVSLLFLLGGPSQEEKHPIVYVKHLEPPLHYPPIAPGARLHGAFFVKLTIAPDGAVLAIQSSPPDAQTAQLGDRLLATGGTVSVVTILCNAQ